MCVVCVHVCVQVSGCTPQDTNHQLPGTGSSSSSSSSTAAEDDGVCAPNLGPGYFKLALGPNTVQASDRLAGMQRTHAHTEGGAGEGSGPASTSGKMQVWSVCV
jgi:hypothetical protein